MVVISILISYYSPLLTENNIDHHHHVHKEVLKQWLPETVASALHRHAWCNSHTQLGIQLMYAEEGVMVWIRGEREQ